MKQMNILGAITVALKCLTSFAWAETPEFRIDHVEGQALVQGENGFISAVPGDAVSAEQKILLKPKSALLLIGRETDCFIHINKPGLYTLAAISDCLPGQVATLGDAFSITPANGTYVSVGSTASSSTAPLVGGLFMASVAATSLTNQVLNDKPVSNH